MNNQQKILDQFIRHHTSEALLALEDLTAVDIAVFLESIPVELAARLLSQMDRYRAAKSIEKIEFKKVAQIIELISIPIAGVLLRQIEPTICDSILDCLPPKTAQVLQRILRFQQNTVGAYINPVSFTLLEENTVDQALQKIKNSNPNLLSHVYILNSNQKLVGYIQLKELIISDGTEKIRSLMRKNPLSIQAGSNFSELLEDDNLEGSFTDLAVIDKEGFFLGVINKDVLTSNKPKKKKLNRELVRTGAALGELYNIGLASFLHTTIEITKKPNP